MLFPNGTIKEGYFEMNIYKGPKVSETQPSQADHMRSTRASSNFYGGPNPTAKGSAFAQDLINIQQNVQLPEIIQPLN
jgi:hypothetical protein